MQYLGSDALDYMSLMVKTFQFIFHMPMLSLWVPPNVMMLYNAVLPIVCWDLLGDWINWEAQNVLLFTPEENAPFPG